MPDDGHMGKLYDSVTPELVEFIARQHMFFVATADASGRVNVSPKGLDSFRVLGPNRVAWLNGTGSGNETAAHLAMVNRMTIMMCAFEGKPWILRLYGTARTIQPGDPDWEELLDLFVPFPGARQVFDMTVDSAQTSCGFGVPFYDYVGQRELLPMWAEKRGPEGTIAYQDKNNAVSLDGLDGHLPPRTPAGIPTSAPDADA